MLKIGNFEDNLVFQAQDRIYDTESTYEILNKSFTHFSNAIKKFEESIDINKNPENIKHHTDTKNIQHMHEFHKQNLEEYITNIEEIFEEEQLKYTNNKAYKNREIISDISYQEIQSFFSKVKTTIQTINDKISALDYQNAYLNNLDNIMQQRRATQSELIDLFMNNNQQRTVTYYNKNGTKKHTNALLKNIEYYKDQILAQFEITAKNGRKMTFASSFKDEKEFFDHVRDITVDLDEKYLQKKTTRNIGNKYIDQIKDINIQANVLKDQIKTLRNGFSRK